MFRYLKFITGLVENNGSRVNFICIKKLAQNVEARNFTTEVIDGIERRVILNLDHLLISKFRRVAGLCIYFKDFGTKHKTITSDIANTGLLDDNVLGAATILIYIDDQSDVQEQLKIAHSKLASVLQAQGLAAELLDFDTLRQAINEAEYCTLGLSCKQYFHAIVKFATKTQQQVSNVSDTATQPASAASVTKSHSISAISSALSKNMSSVENPVNLLSEVDKFKRSVADAIVDTVDSLHDGTDQNLDNNLTGINKNSIKDSLGKPINLRSQTKVDSVAEESEDLEEDDSSGSESFQEEFDSPNSKKTYMVRDINLPISVCLNSELENLQYLVKSFSTLETLDDVSTNIIGQTSLPLSDTLLKVAESLPSVPDSSNMKALLLENSSNISQKVVNSVLKDLEVCSQIISVMEESQLALLVSKFCVQARISKNLNLTNSDITSLYEKDRKLADCFLSEGGCKFILVILSVQYLINPNLFCRVIEVVKPTLNDFSGGETIELNKEDNEDATLTGQLKKDDGENNKNNEFVDKSNIMLLKKASEDEFTSEINKSNALEELATLPLALDVFKSAPELATLETLTEIYTALTVNETLIASCNKDKYLPTFEKMHHARLAKFRKILEADPSPLDSELLKAIREEKNLLGHMIQRIWYVNDSGQRIHLGDRDFRS